MKYDFNISEDVYRGLDLWMLNDQLDDDELIYQINQFKEKGFYSVIARTYNGLKSDYPGKDFMHKMDVIVSEAKKCGLKIVLQAGYMPAAVPDIPHEYSMRYIFPIKTAELQGTEKVIYKDGIWTYTELEKINAINLFDSESVQYYILKTYEEMWSQFKEEYGETVIAVWVDEPRYNPAMIPWTSSISKCFHNKYGYKIEDHIALLYHNTGDYKKVRYHYFTLLEEKMADHYFAQIRDWCHKNKLQFCGHLMGEELLSSQISQACAIMPYYKYFDIPGIDMLRTEQNWSHNPIKPLTYLWDENSVDVERMMYIPPVQCVSAAHQSGKKHVLCEMYGVSSTNLTFRDQMHLFDFFAANGINHQCIHALFYSIGGFRKRFYPQQINVYQPFWNSYKNIKDYVARVSKFISCGKKVCNVLVIHPLETAYGIFCGLLDKDEKTPWQTVNDFDKIHYRFIMSLFSNQIDFEYGDQFTMATESYAENGSLIIGEMAYKTVILPDIEVIDSRVLKTICDFAKSGGRLIVMGNLPNRLDGAYYEGLEQIFLNLPNIIILSDKESVIWELKKEKKDFEYIGNSNISCTVINRRTDNDKNYFMVHNRDCAEPKTGKLVINGIHKAVRYDPIENKQYKIYSYESNGKTIIPFENPAGGSTFLYTFPADSISKDPPQAKRVTSLSFDDMQFEARNDNLMTLEYCSFKTAEDDSFSKEYVSERVMEILKGKKYTGKVILRFRFFSDFEPKNIKLIAEEPELCEFSLNGLKFSNKSEGYYFSKAFRVIPLPDAIRKGENTIEITRFTEPAIAKNSNTLSHLFELFRSPVGVDLERIHLVGNFYVDALPEASLDGLSRYSKRFCLTESRKTQGFSDMTLHGYPFYIGGFVYSRNLILYKKQLKARDIRLCIGIFNTCTADVCINNQRIGSLNNEPFSISVKDALKHGKNTIEIHAYNTLRNAIGPSHMRNMDVGSSSKVAWLGKTEDFEKTEYDSLIWTNSFENVPYGLGNISLHFYG